MRTSLRSLAVAAILTISAAADLQPAPPRWTRAQLIAEGMKVYGRVTTRYPNTELILSGGLDPRVSLDMVLPSKAWNALTGHEKVALSYYIESEIATVRRNPSRYSLTPSDAPIWGRFAANYQKICGTCWTVWVGQYTRSAGASMDDIVLAGDGRWSMLAGGTKSIQASTFRKKVLGAPPR